MYFKLDPGECGALLSLMMLSNGGGAPQLVISSMKYSERIKTPLCFGLRQLWRPWQVCSVSFQVSECISHRIIFCVAFEAKRKPSSHVNSRCVSTSAFVELVFRWASSSRCGHAYSAHEAMYMYVVVLSCFLPTCVSTHPRIWWECRSTDRDCSSATSSCVRPRNDVPQSRTPRDSPRPTISVPPAGRSRSPGEADSRQL